MDFNSLTLELLYTAIDREEEFTNADNSPSATLYFVVVICVGGIHECIYK